LPSSFSKTLLLPVYKANKKSHEVGGLNVQLDGHLVL